MTIFEKNIQALKNSLSQEFIDMVISAELPEWADQINSKDGTPNLLVSNGNARETIYPIEGWKKDINERLKNMTFDGATATLCIGMGLGFFLEKVGGESNEKHIFIVVEPEPGIIKLALENCDLSEHLLSKKIIIAPTTEDVTFTLEFINENKTIDDWMVIVEKYALNHNTYTSISIAAMNALNQIRCNIGTVVGAGKQIADNDIANLPYIIHKRGISELKGLYKGLPAILVSTGPSLGKNLYRLIKAQENAIIIAVGQALRPLLSYGIRPDFICSVDFGEVNLTHYDGLMEEDVPLVVLNRSFALLLKRWQGPLFVSASPMIPTHSDHENRVHKILTEKGGTLQGGSVAHMNYGLALTLGCSPIVLIGQDLAYEGDQSHFPQADTRGILRPGPNGDLQWVVKDPRSHLNETNYTMGPPVTVPGYYLKDVMTNSGLSSFITSFENLFAMYPNTPVINATEGGAHIKHSTRMSLKEVLEKYCAKKIKGKRDKLKPLLSEADNAEELIGQAIPLLQKEIDLLSQIDLVVKKAIATNRKMTRIRLKNWSGTKEQKYILRKTSDKNQKYSNKAYELCMRLPLVQLALYGANRQIQHHSMVVDRSAKNFNEDYQNAKINLKRNRIILNAVYDSSRSLKKTYNVALGELKRMRHLYETQSIFRTPQPEPKPHIDDAEGYFSVGNFARPMLESKKILDHLAEKNNDLEDSEIKELNDRAFLTYLTALEMRHIEIKKAKDLPDRSKEIQYVEMITEGQKIGREEQDFDHALELFEKAIKIYPEGELGRWGLATTYMHLEMYDKSIGEFKKLIELKPEAYRYQFEMGQVMVAKGDSIEGLKQINKAMENTNEFDVFFFVIGDMFCTMEKYKEAIIAYESYLKNFPGDYKVMEKMLMALTLMQEQTIKEYDVKRKQTDDEFEMKKIQDHYDAIIGPLLNQANEIIKSLDILKGGEK